MKIYLATSQLSDLAHFYSIATPEELAAFRVLFSYHYLHGSSLEQQRVRFFRDPYPAIFFDSGAYSAMTKGLSISVHEYGRWLQQYHRLVEVYANLDVIKDAQRTWDHQKCLEEEYGLSPLPVFHVAEKWIWLERYLEKYPSIALGVAGTRHQQYFSWLVRCFQIAQGSGVKFHGFGITTWNVLCAFPWYSADSTTWCSGFQYGRIVLFDEHIGRFQLVQLGSRHCFRYASIIRSLGFDPEDFADLTRNTRALNCQIALRSYVRAQWWLGKRWKTCV